jgi:hypothetical protein
MGHAGFLGGLPDATRDFIDNHIVVGGISSQQTADANDGAVLAGLGERTGGGGNFKGTRNPDNVDGVVLGTRAKQSVIGAAQQAIGNEFIEPRNNNAEAKPRRV